MARTRQYANIQPINRLEIERYCEEATLDQCQTRIEMIRLMAYIDGFMSTQAEWVMNRIHDAISNKFRFAC